MCISQERTATVSSILGWRHRQIFRRRSQDSIRLYRMSGNHPSMIALKIVVMVGIVAGLARSAPAIPITDGLIGYWPAEGNGADLSGFGRDLTLNGGLGFSAGLVGQAFNFHHNNAQYASRSVDDAAFDFGASDFTLQVWAKFNNFSDEHTLIEKFNGPGGAGWTLTQRSGPFLHFYVNFGALVLDTGENVPLPGLSTNDWHDILVRRSGSAFTMFFDGSAVVTKSVANINFNTSQPLRIGNRLGIQSFPMDGAIDEAAIWNRALSDAEVTTLYLTLIPEPSASVVAALGLAAFTIGGQRRHRLTRLNIQP